MTLRIMISNLPPETTVEGLREALAEHGIAAEVVLNDEGNADRVTAILAVEDLDRPAADRLAAKIDGTIYAGRRLRAYVPLFF